MTGEQLRAARLELGWSQDAAARALAVASRQAISRWERDERPVPAYVAAHVRTLRELCASCRRRLVEPAR